MNSQFGNGDHPTSDTNAPCASEVSQYIVCPKWNKARLRVFSLKTSLYCTPSESIIEAMTAQIIVIVKVSTLIDPRGKLSTLQKQPKR